MKLLCTLIAAVLLAGCSSAPKPPPPVSLGSRITTEEIERREEEMKQATMQAYRAAYEFELLGPADKKSAEAEIANARPRTIRAALEQRAVAPAGKWGALAFPNGYLRQAIEQGRRDGRLEATRQRREAFIAENPKLTEGERDSIRSGSFNIGMTDSAVRASIGAPNHVNRTVFASGVQEQWVYDNSTYLYFENGVLRSYQQTGR